MKVISKKSFIDGTVDIPGSKSHTIRALIIGALAHGESIIESPLDSLDTQSAAHAVSEFGATVDMTSSEQWVVNGVDGKPGIPDDVIDVGNSGTTLYMIMGTASLVDGCTILTGDHQIRRRTAAPLIEALPGLGVEVFSTRGNGMAPLVLKGKMTGGETTVAGISSQYVSSLLMACPLASDGSLIRVIELNERPYVRMTLDWLESQGISLDINDDLSQLEIGGGQSYRPFRRKIPGDFSSATFILCAAALSGGKVTLRGLEMDDPQGDKAVIDILRTMGTEIEIGDGTVTVHGGALKAAEVDMNAIPDALPMLSVCACFAEGTTVLYNVGQARMKETDRIAVMAQELSKLGGDVKEMPDGLTIRGTGLKGGQVKGHGDHRVVMAMTVAGLVADSEITVDTAEAADITFPDFWGKMKSLGSVIEVVR